jgi:hypothetical protein
MNNQENGHDFFSILQKRDPFLASTYENVKKRSLEGWGNMFGKDHGSFSGFPHLRDVERNANHIVPDEIKETFSTGEIFLLLNAIFLHDIGKTVEKVNNPFDRCDKKDKCKENKDGQKKCQLPENNHHARSKEVILDRWAELGLPDRKMAEYCAMLAFCHNLNQPPTIDQKVIKKGSNCVGVWEREKNYHSTSIMPYGKIRVPLLASILRIADETDDSWLRAFPDSLLNLYKKDIGKSFRRYIEDVEFCHQGRCIILHIPSVKNPQEDPDYEKKENEDQQLSQNNMEIVKRINDVRTSIESVLTKWGGDLAHIDIKFDDVLFESNNHLLNKLNTLYENETYEPLINVIGEKKKDRLRKLFDALIELSFGTKGYETFTWDTIEAQVGQSLESVDKWLVEKIADNSNDCIVFNDEKVHMRSINDNYEYLRNYVLGSDGGENEQTIYSI